MRPARDTGIEQASPTPAGALRLAQGPLARRIVDALGGNITHERLHDVYARLCDCLARGELFTSH